MFDVLKNRDSMCNSASSIYEERILLVYYLPAKVTLTKYLHPSAVGDHTVMFFNIIK